MSTDNVQVVVSCSKCGSEVKIALRDYRKLLSEDPGTPLAKGEIELREEGINCPNCGTYFTRNQKYIIEAMIIGGSRSGNHIAQYYLLRTLEEFEAGNLGKAEKFLEKALEADPMIILREHMPNSIPVTVGPNSIKDKPGV